MNLNSYKSLVYLCLGCIVLSCNNQKQPDKALSVGEKPNILIIFPDQLRRYSAGYWTDSPYKAHAQGKTDPVITPTINTLARNGIVFTNAISNFPLCSPYRGMMLSGMYPEQNGIWNNCKVGRDNSLRDDIETIPDLFFKAGYNTSYFGKCHWLRNDPVFDENGNYVGSKEHPGGYYINNYDTYVPPGKPRHSIEYFYQALKDEHFNPMVYSNIPEIINGKGDGELHLPKMFSVKNEAAQIISYLKNEHGYRNTSKPFCMIWSINPPHNPWDDQNTDMEVFHDYYDSDKFPEIDTTIVVRKNASLEVASYARHYYANVSSTDKYIGQVIAELERMGELENTIVVFSSDHGEMLGSHSKTGKNTFETEALAIPLIVHWPKSIEPGIEDMLFSVPDVLPTVMGLAGLKDKIPKAVEGTDFSSLLKSDKVKVKRPEAVLLMLGNSRGVRTERYTLCIEESKEPWDSQESKTIEKAYFYDNKEDPYQLHKIALETSPQISEVLLSQLGTLLKNTNDPWYQSKKHKHLIQYPE